MARVELIAPTWEYPLALARPKLPSVGRLAIPWQRARRHVVVATIALLAGIVLWLPGGFELALAVRLAIGVITGAGLAAIATTISLGIPSQ